MENERRRFLALMLVTFFGVKRFSDVNKVRVRDVDFKGDGSVEVWMKYSKKDSVGKGEVFKIPGRRSRGVSVGKILRWYIRSLRLGLDEFLFCRLGSRGEVFGKDFMVRPGRAWRRSRRSWAWRGCPFTVPGWEVRRRRQPVAWGGQRSRRQAGGGATRWTSTCRPRGRARWSAGLWWIGSSYKVGLKREGLINFNC